MQRFIVGSLAVVLLLAGCATAPTEFREPAAMAGADRATLNSRVFAAAWEAINQNYFDPKFQGVDWPAMRVNYDAAAAAAPDDQSLYDVLGRMTAELRDKHTFPISPQWVHAGRIRHSVDLGFLQRKVDGRWVVTDIAPGGPAEAAGVKPGWLIVSRDEQPLPAEISSTTFLARVGEPVRFVFVDEHDESRAITIAPQLLSFVQQRPFVSREAAGGYRYLRFDHFDSRAIKWLGGEVDAHRDAPGVILDLRHNAGGRHASLRRAVRTFFPDGQRLGQIVDRSGKARHMGTLSLGVSQYTGNVVILTGHFTASSAEIFSHALQYHRRAVVIGQQTAGLVLGGRKHRLPGGGYINVTELDFIGLDGRRLEGVGVTPDIAVSPALADLRAGRDLALEAALTSLRNRGAEN